MFLLGSTHIGVDMYRVLDAFIFKQGVQTPNEALSVVNVRSYLVKTSVYYLQTLVADAFWLYRAYIVWNNDKRVGVGLGMCLLGTVVTGARVIELFTHASNGGDPIFASQYHVWAISFLLFTLATNLGSTSLIACRIWYMHHKTQTLFSAAKEVHSNQLPTIAVMVIESGAIYSVTSIVLLVLYLCGSYAQYIVYDAITQLIGIVFTVIILRAVLGISNYQTSHLPSVVIPPRELEVTTTQHSIQRPVLIHATKSWSPSTSISHDEL
ncbi:hypothetical protein VNI00_010417 [Paramarasmius palmivorus]|uniref:Uncharacterized protein n=1 Tax=Paramarasmius palmivorus TaxID=297713 RepID=A0AAW0CH63_9AGAR